MSISVRVKGKHLQVTDGLREYAEQHLQGLEKYFGHIHHATVVESIEGPNEHRVEVTLEGDDGLIIRGEERSENMYKSVDRVVDKLVHRVKKHKEKSTHLRNHQQSLRTQAEHNDSALFDGVLPADTHLDPDLRPRIMRTKEVTMKPMSIDDAVRMLELTDHEWFVYLDSDTSMTNVVYRRRDGHYGLVVPKI